MKAFAQALRAGYLRLEFIHAQAFVSTATGFYLDWHGIQAGGLSRNPAMFATGLVRADAVLGAVIEDGWQLARSDGALYIVVGTTTAVTTPVTLAVRAVTAGPLSNTDGGAPLTAVVGIAGVTNFVVGTDGIIGGKDPESDDSFRQRILFHKQNPPHGGSPAEYVEWGQTKYGVTRVFVQRATPAPGSVTIYFMMDSVGTGIPFAADVDEMQAILDTLAPADAHVIVAAPVAEAINVTITGLVPDTPQLRDAVTSELKAQFLRRAEPASVTTPFIFARAWLDEAVSKAAGWQRSTITVPTGDVSIATPGHIAVLGTITFA
jgi:uncharacterized phage protein gp47/JayE